MKALEKERGRRYQTAAAFAADVQRYLGDEPVAACPPSTSYRLGKFARRHRGALAVAGILDPHYLSAYLDRGWILLYLNRPEAIADFTQAIKLAPAHWNWCARGGAYETLGQWDKALADFSRVIELEPKAGPGYIRRSRVHAILEQWSKAAADLDVALEHEPGDDRAGVELACYRAALDDHARYAKACHALVDRFGQTKDAGVAQRIALACFLMPTALKDEQRATQLADFGAAGAPDKTWRLITHAASLYRQGKFAQTGKPLQQVLQNLPNNTPAAPTGEILVTWLLLAMANHQLGQTNQAIGWLDQAARQMDQLKSAQEIGPIRRDTPHLWAMCLALRREAEALLKN